MEIDIHTEGELLLFFSQLTQDFVIIRSVKWRKDLQTWTRNTCLPDVHKMSENYHKIYCCLMLEAASQIAYN